jgi:microcephalin
MNTHKALVQTPSASNDTLETSIDKATILKDICVYVDVQAKNEDRSDVVVKKVLTLGAKVSKSLGKQCSHMVFKEGNLTTYNKAKSLGLFIVSVNWVEACEKENKVVDENLYPTMNKEKYEKEVLPGVTPKLTRRRSLQPKTDEEFSKQIDAKLSRRSSANNSKISEESSAETSKVKPEKFLQVLLLFQNFSRI